MSERYFVVNDDVVVADCPTAELAAKVSCCLTLPHKYYRLTVSAIVGKGIQVGVDVLALLAVMKGRSQQ